MRGAWRAAESRGPRRDQMRLSAFVQARSRRRAAYHHPPHPDHPAAHTAAAAALRDGLERVGLPEIVSFTATTNLRSQAVMRRIGLHRRPDLDFDHPRLAADHPLRPHIVFSTRPAG